MCKENAVICCEECKEICKKVRDSGLIELVHNLREEKDRINVNNILKGIENILAVYNSYPVECLKDRCSYLISYIHESNRVGLWEYELMNIRAFVAEMQTMLDS